MRQRVESQPVRRNWALDAKEKRKLVCTGSRRHVHAFDIATKATSSTKLTLESHTIEL